MAKRKTRKPAKYDVASHNLVPKHSKLSKKDIKVLLDRYQIQMKDLPKILIDDPAIAGLEVEEGDVIKIERNSPTSGKTVYYRGVING